MDGIRFHSKKEARRWGELKLLEKAGEIWLLRRQLKYTLLVNDHQVGAYIADFSYFSYDGLVVEDVKSPITRRNPVYQLKKKLMFAIHGITIVET